MLIVLFLNDPQALMLLRARALVIDAITTGLATQNGDHLVSATTKLIEMQSLAASSSGSAAAATAIDGLLQDMSGQINEALTNNAYYSKWGRHYLPSLRRAHELQQCNNFKDPYVPTRPSSRPPPLPCLPPSSCATPDIVCVCDCACVTCARSAWVSVCSCLCG